MQIAHGFQDPAIDQMPRLRQILKGVKVECGKQRKASRSTLPITPSILRRLKSTWLGENPLYEALMLWSTSLTTFFSFCRSGEITVENENKYDPNTHLSFGDVSVDNAVSPSVVQWRSQTFLIPRAIRSHYQGQSVQGCRGLGPYNIGVGPFCAISNGEFSKYCAKHNQHA